MGWMLVHVIKNCTYVFIREEVSILTDKIFVNRNVIFFLERRFKQSVIVIGLEKQSFKNIEQKRYRNYPKKQC